MIASAVRIILDVFDAGGRLMAPDEPSRPVLIAIDGNQKLRANVLSRADEIRRHLIGHETLRPLERGWEACVKDIGGQWEEGGHDYLGLRCGAGGQERDGHEA